MTEYRIIAEGNRGVYTADYLEREKKSAKLKPQEPIDETARILDKIVDEIFQITGVRTVELKVITE